MMKHLFIINPHAGGGKETELLIREIKDTFKGLDFAIELTHDANDATNIAKQYVKEGQNMTVYACGGDGTLNEVVNGIYGFDNARLGLIPEGTGNDFIKTLKYDESEMRDLKRYLNPGVIDCDLLSTSGRIGINTMSVGLDALIAENVIKFKNFKKFGSIFPYFLSYLYSMKEKAVKHYTVFIDDKLLGDADYLFLVAGNGRYYGGGYCPVPMAEINDGIMDICLIKPMSKPRMLQLTNHYRKGTHTDIDAEKIKIYHGKKLKLMCQDELIINVDGEIVHAQNPTIQLLPGAVKLVLPGKVND